MAEGELELSASDLAILSRRGCTILEQLGKGSYATVYLTKSNAKNVEQKLACKIIDTSRSSHLYSSKFVPREIEVLMNVHHPYIVQIHSILERSPRYFIFMRHAENGDIFDFLQKNGAVKENQARIWHRQMSSALNYLHAMGIVHRDLKCENLLVTANFNVKLADFGFVTHTTDHYGKSVLSSTYCGSLSYTAPEVLRGCPYDPVPSDIWSLGVVLYVMLNKSIPFPQLKVKVMYDAQMSKDWNFREKVVDKLSDAVKEVVIKLLEPEVTKRWDLEHVLRSDWIAKDFRLVTFSPEERDALNHAFEERNKWIQIKTEEPFKPNEDCRLG